MDPNASRETLDHSIMYIFTIALEDGAWHHVDSYTPERAGRADTVKLWHKIETCEDPEWTSRYHDSDPKRKAFGARVEITFKNGEKLIDELALANAHSDGARPFGRAEYIKKFETLTTDIITPEESARFLETVQNLPNLSGEELLNLNVQVSPDKMPLHERDTRGIF
jgi:2-methylcitrate dehydratase